MAFQHPFQAVQQLGSREPGRRSFLIAAAGPKIYTYDIENGRQLSVWPQCPKPQENEPAEAPSREEGDSETQGPPEKKRKLSSSAVDNEADNSHDTPSKNPEPKQKSATEWTTVPILATSADGKHLIALTGEDKCIRVLDVDEGGKISQLSGRCMPKRPSSITVTPDNSTILCGDKFGDVYELPLFPSEEVSLPTRKHPQSEKPYQPAATKLTVHTKRNIQSLEQQLKASNTASERSTPTFKHKLLLGHVSLLTDVAFATVPAEKSPSGKPRNYILTSDRDEHIRVSRGPPQCHIIENYCLGHTSFVNKLCIPQSRQDILISGGGDGLLFVWNWLEGKVLQQVQLGPILDSQELAVLGIWAVPVDEETTAIIVACEGIPSLLCFRFGRDGTLTPCAPIQVAGNVLSATCIKDSTIIVSVDNCHEPQSTKALRNAPTSSQTLLQAFKLVVENEGLNSEPVLGTAIDSVNSQGTFSVIDSTEDEASKEKKAKALRASLYYVENLRKKTYAEEG